MKKILILTILLTGCVGHSDFHWNKDLYIRNKSGAVCGHIISHLDSSFGAATYYHSGETAFETKQEAQANVEHYCDSDGRR